jgi:hypothetical protein
MGYAIGIVLAVCVAVLARAVRFDRDRAFYPTVLVVIASYDVLFAVMGGSMRALIVESMVMSAFTLAAVIGFKRNLWLVVAGLAAHGTFDFFHASIVTNPGVPEWWPAFCLAVDVGFAAFLAWLSSRSQSTHHHIRQHLAGAAVSARRNF